MINILIILNMSIGLVGNLAPTLKGQPCSKLGHYWKYWVIVESYMVSKIFAFVAGNYVYKRIRFPESLPMMHLAPGNSTAA